MKTIWKYPLEVIDEQAVSMPRGAKILSVQVQEGKICLWALVDQSAKLEQKIILITGTGHPAPSHDEYLGTVQMGQFVWHVFLLSTPT